MLRNGYDVRSEFGVVSALPCVIVLEKSIDYSARNVVELLNKSGARRHRNGGNNIVEVEEIRKLVEV